MWKQFVLHLQVHAINFKNQMSKRAKTNLLERGMYSLDYIMLTAKIIIAKIVIMPL